jgi:hypothetical protein
VFASEIKHSNENYPEFGEFQSSSTINEKKKTKTFAENKFLPIFV